MNPVTGLSVARIALGVAAVANPELTTTLFRLDGPANRQLPYMTRMFGAREIALGAMTLVAKGAARRKLIALGIAVDGSDAFAGYDAMRTGAVDERAGMFLTAPPIAAMAVGAIGMVTTKR